MPSMNFILTGRDHLSRVMDRAGDASNRLGRRLLAMSINSDAAVRRFTNNATRNLSGMQRDTDAGGKALEELKKASMLLAPAAIPAAASLVPIAAGAATVAVAAGAMTAAIVPQIGALGEASDAQQKYQDAVAKSGARSEQAAKAEAQALAAMSKLPPETRRAAVAYGLLKDSYKSWSDGLAQDTMGPVVKGLGIANALLPKTTGLVKSASRETDRFLTLVGGEMASPGLDQLNSKFSNYADKTLRRVNDEIVHLLRVQDSGSGGGKTREFLDWARAQGPTVAAILRDVASAVLHVLKGASETGVSLLQLVGVVARLVSAVPPSAVATFLQLALALKLTKAAALGMVAARTAVAGFATQLIAMQTAAAAAPGRLAAVRAAVLALSRTTKIAMAGTGLGLAILAVTELAERSKHAPPDIDLLTKSLRELGSTGKVTGEAAKAFGTDLDGLYGKVRSLTDPTTTDKVQQFLVGWTGWDSTPVKEAKANLDSVDSALANLVQGGQADLAAAAVKRLSAEYGKGGRDSKEFTDQLDGYKAALADAAFEQKLAADSMGLFGSQAQSVQQKLNAQKMSADGLRQSIVALSETHRNAFDAETKFEAAVDAVTKALKDNGATLDAGTDKGRANRDALSQLASATEDAATKARENGASWSQVAAIYDKGRKALVDNAAAMTGSRKEAERLAGTLLTMPSPKMRLEMRTEDAVKNLDAVIAAINKAPKAKSVTVSALTADAVRLLQSLGFTVTHMKDGRFKVTADTATAKANVAAVQRARDALKSKTINLAARDQASKTARDIAAAIAQIRSKTVTLTTVRHTIGIEGSAGRNAKNLAGYAGGGTPRRGEVAWVGEHGPELMAFDGSEKIFDHARSMAMIKPSAQAIRVTSPQPVAPRALAGTRGAGGGPLTVHITVNGATDPDAAARELEKVLKKYKRGRGGADYGF